MNENRFYICEYCGNIVGMIHDIKEKGNAYEKNHIQCAAQSQGSYL